ncbi:MAG: hypothetical protein ACYC1M_06460 [Armatimonadota bacterium]
MKPNIRSTTLVLAAVLFSMFWMDRGVYRTWIVDHGITVRYYMLSFCLHHSPVIWPGLRYWDLCGHTDDVESQQPEQLLHEFGTQSHRTSDLAVFARLATMVTSNPQYLAGSSPKKKQLDNYIAVMKRGEQIDPTNALYNLLQSQVLLSHTTVHASKPPNRDGTQQGSRIVVTDANLFREGLRQFQLARKKQLRLYEYDHLKADFRKLHTPLLWEHYESRRGLDEEAAMQMRVVLSSDPIINAAQYYLEKGDQPTARKLMDIKSFTWMMLADKRASETRQQIVSNFNNQAATVLDGVPRVTMDSLICLAPGLPIIRRDFIPISHRGLSEDMSRYWIGWDAINVVIQQQAVWVWLCFGMALLVVISLIRDLVWWIACRVKRKSVAEFVWPHQPSRLALGFALAAMILTVVQITALHIWVDDVTAVWRRTQYVAPLLLIVGWISVRFEFKRHCQLQGLPVPGRWAEMVYNWLPVAGVIGIYAISGYLNDLRMDLADRSLLMVVASCLISAAIIPTLSRKYRIQDYYILANRETRRFLACMVVFVSVGVMPLQILHEVVLLQSDHTGTGAFRSVELLRKLDQAANREYMQKIDDYLKDNRR